MRILQQAITFDDVLLVPSFSQVLPREVDITTPLTRNLRLNIPLISAAMDTVTESRLAIALAQEGGIGIVHKNMSVDRQAEEVRRVKKHESGVIKDPLTVSADTSIKEVLEITKRHQISGLPVVDGEALVGVVTSRDLRFETHFNDPVSNIMTKKDRLVTIGEGATRDEIKALLHQHRIEKLLVVNEAFELRGLVTVKDIQKTQAFPNACKDDDAQLRVGGAIGVGNVSRERVEALVGVGVDVIVVDTAHGHAASVVEMVAWIKKTFPDLDLIAGNVATAAGALALVEAGADAVKVGIGPGSICTTRIISGVGVPQITAIADVAQALVNHDVPMIADGGIRFSGDIAKAIAAGAYSVMIGGLFAGTEEAPGEVELFKGRAYRAYRGMGSLGAMGQQHNSSDRYFQDNDDPEKLVPEGIEGRVPYRGPLAATIRQLLGGLRAAMGYTGSPDLKTMRTAEFIRLTNAGIQESHVHDVTITKEPPNYQLR